MSENFQNMYAIYDNKAETYHAPFFAPTDGAAMRMVMDALNDPNHMLSRHPADFNLFHVGHWKSQTGEVFGVQAPRQLGILVEFMPKPAQPLPMFPEVKNG